MMSKTAELQLLTQPRHSNETKEMRKHAELPEIERCSSASAAKYFFSRLIAMRRPQYYNLPIPLPELSSSPEIVKDTYLQS